MATSGPVIQAALERGRERAAFISEACGGDDSLRREVEALLAAEGRAGSLIEAPAYAVAAPLLAGEEAQCSLARTSAITTSFRSWARAGWARSIAACDTRLDRTVALKMLPAEVLSSMRSECGGSVREAKAASRAQPSECRVDIYEIGDADGRELHCDGVRRRHRRSRPGSSAFRLIG